ncbi:hypothetical protein GCM10009775_21960 [Microbacterium aoyamense]|uniref:Uncharacterized protein n=1 Tax=Microbacterium aoyamense TaxID=344166 RepID=A0ABP5B6A0_9MICO|nr:hypothetical protein [Microbacterium aoyamense]
MARIPGRNSWIAVPAGLICAGVVGALLWFSLPMMPVAAAWVGQTAHRALTEPLVTMGEPAHGVADLEAVRDCRDLYPENVWAELQWRGEGLLAQTTDPPSTAATTVVEALAPTVRLTCAWSYPDGGSLVSTLADVDVDAAAVAQAGFEGAGFTCTSDSGILRCTLARDGGLEEHVLREGLWLYVFTKGWSPGDFASRMSGFVLG